MRKALFLLTVFSFTFYGFSQEFDLNNWVIPEGVVIKNENYKNKAAIEVTNNAKEIGGVVYLKGLSLTNGVIECDIASNTMVGLTFRVQNESTAECIYFRPFNSGGDMHDKTVQYVARGTKYKWKYLRENFPGKYESGANMRSYEWFHARIIFKDRTVKVYVNNSETPVLVVDDLKLNAETGSVGLWTWKGHYANFSVSELE